MQSLLLAILSRMAEMDGVHGVRQSNGLEFRARAGAARERADWRQALASFDSLMQRGQHQGQGPAEGVAEGVAVALQRLDLMHVLGAYVTGMQSRADSVHSTTLKELEYERRYVMVHFRGAVEIREKVEVPLFPKSATRDSQTAPEECLTNACSSCCDRRWRMCRWEPLGDGLIGPEAYVPQYATDAARVGGDGPLPSQEAGEGLYQYHEHVHACLRALGSKDAAGVSRHLRIARLKTMACLTHEVTMCRSILSFGTPVHPLEEMLFLCLQVPFEASRRLPQLLGQLQGLREVEEVAKVGQSPGCTHVLGSR